MKITFNFLSYFRKRQIRSILRGYKKMRKHGQLSVVTKIKNEISSERAISQNDETAAYIFHSSLPNAELIIRQYLMVRIAGVSINRSILAAEGSSPVPFHVVPPSVRKILKSNNIPINSFFSAIAWNSYIFLIWCYGLIEIFMLLFSLAPRIKRYDEQNRRETTYFFDLLQNNLPNPSNENKNYSLISWYFDWSERPKEIKYVAHSRNFKTKNKQFQKKIISGVMPFSYFSKWHQWWKFLLWVSFAIPTSLFDFFRGRWWHPFLLAEASKARAVELHEQNDLFKAYWFPHSRYIYRPIWTYIAEQKGSEITLFFYSVNNNAIQKAGAKDIELCNWHLMSWPNLIIWNKQQKEIFEDKVTFNVKYEIVGDVPFCDSDISIPNFKGRSIALFDIQPFRPLKHATIAQVYEYYCAQNCIDFLKDVNFAADENDIKILWKRKRDISKDAHPKYINLSSKIAQKSNNIISIDTSVAAHRVIEKSDFVVSLPFTSTALIGLNLGKPSCYYDPTGLLDPNDEAAYGVPILQGRENISNWIRSNF